MNSTSQSQGVIIFYSVGQNDITAIVITSNNTIERIVLLDIPNITNSISNGSSNAVTSGAVYTALQAKQDVITDHIILTSSTADSTKRFKITVDDSGTLTATEVTA